MRTFKAALESYWGWKSECVPKSANEVALSPHKFEEYCRELNELKDQARRLVKEKIAELKLEIERKEQELEHLEEKGWLGSKNLKERAVDEQLRQLLKKPKPKPGSVSSYMAY